jgi:exosortase A-associated hydrolase 2
LRFRHSEARRLTTSAAPLLDPFFLDGGSGRVFCLFVGPIGASRRSVLFVPPFAEEMNKARRQLALQARSFAAAGCGALLLDLSGTGDSEGEFLDARWEHWVDDVRAGLRWLEQRGAERVVVLGARFGALLSAEAVRSEPRVERLVFWQPVINGRQHIDQFLRLRVAASLTDSASGVTVRGLRESLNAATPLEVGGYALHPALVRSIDQQDLAKSAPPRVPVSWMELVREEGRGVGAGSDRAIAAWREAGAQVDASTVVGEQFWSTVEISTVPSLIEHTTRCVTGDR